MRHMILLLKRSPDSDAQLERFQAEQQDPASPNFHRWLTPEQFGERFGVPQARIEAVRDWLRSCGFSIDEVAQGRMTINFSGDAGQVERAFRVSMRSYLIRGEVHYANAGAASVPRALADVVQGIVSLNDIPIRAVKHHGGPRK